jgi:hypothetical protein
MKIHSTTLLGALAALALPAAASAATPDTAKVSPTAKTASWTGDITEPFGLYDLTAFFNGSTEVGGNETCTAPVCDTFALDVADGGTALTVKIDAPDADNLAVEVVDPNGGATNYNDVDPATSRTLELPTDPGTWTFKTYGTGEFTYTAKATFSTDPQPTDEAAATRTARKPSKKAKARKAKALRAARRSRR